MPSNELFRPLDYLDAAQDILHLSMELKNRYAISSEIYKLASELEAKAGFSTGRFSEKSAFYRLLLAYARLASSNWVQAKRDADSAVRLFVQLGDKHNEAISRWFLGLLLCICEDLDEAEIKVSEARAIISKLDNKLRFRGEYALSDKSYGYMEILDEIDASFAALKDRVLKDLPRIKRKPALDQEYFLEVMSCLKIPAELTRLNMEQFAALAHATQPLEEHALIMKLEQVLNQWQDEDEERLLIRILLAHQSNLNDYANGEQGSRAMAFLEDAMDQYSSDHANYFLCRAYLSLLCYNRDVEGNGQKHLESACLYLEKTRQEYERQGNADVANRLQYLQNAIHLWFRAVEVGPFENHHAVPPFRKHSSPSDKVQHNDMPLPGEGQ